MHLTAQKIMWAENRLLSSVTPTPPATATTMATIILLITAHETLEQLPGHALPSKHIL